MFSTVLAVEVNRPYGNRNRDHIYQGNEECIDLHRELWQACAGPRVYVPKVGDRVFYFLQGHLEQIEVSMVKDGEVELPKYNVPPKILCKAINVVLKAEHQTDEIFAEVTLIPEARLSQQDISPVQDEEIPILAQENQGRFLAKILTSSDTATHGSLSLPKRQAEECLPPLDMTQKPPVQDLVARDLQGVDWHFRHTYRGQPKRHLITSGWSTFFNRKKLAPGDTCIFLSGPRGGDLLVGVRHSMKSHKSTQAPVISAVTMQHGILACAFHAISTGSPFTLYHRPGTSAEFIIPCHQYSKSIENNFSVGDLVITQLNGKEYAGQSWLGGIVIGIGHKDQFKCPSSEWRSIEVKWKAVPGKQTPPRRVSPWEIEPLDWTKMKQPQYNQTKRKRSHSPDMWMASVEHGPWFLRTWDEGIHREVFKGQDCDIALGEANVAEKTPSTLTQVPQVDPDQSILLGLNNPSFVAGDMVHEHIYSPWDMRNFEKDDASVSVAQPNGSRKVMKLFGESVELPSLPSCQF